MPVIAKALIIYGTLSALSVSLCAWGLRRAGSAGISPAQQRLLRESNWMIMAIVYAIAAIIPVLGFCFALDYLAMALGYLRRLRR